MNINSLSSHLKSETETSKLAPLAERVMKRADVNRDGDVTSAEFSDFLSKLSASLEAELPAPRAHQATMPAAPASVPPVPAASSTISASAAAMLRLVANNLPKDR